MSCAPLEIDKVPRRRNITNGPSNLHPDINTCYWTVHRRGLVWLDGGFINISLFILIITQTAYVVLGPSNLHPDIKGTLQQRVALSGLVDVASVGPLHEGDRRPCSPKGGRATGL